MPIRLLLAIILLIFPMVPTFWAIQDIPKRRFPTRKRKIVWFLLASSLPFVGAMCYILFIRKTTAPSLDGELSSN
jgi:drug/metabolite transporter (DMT)-like permease